MAVKINYNRIFLTFGCFLLAFCILLSAVFLKIKPLVYTHPKSHAKTLFLNSANTAVVNILKTNDISYNDIATLSKTDEGNVTSLEINIEKINLLKSLISNEISKTLSGKEYYDLKIPLGTLLGSEYTTGFGPRVTFKMQVAATTVVDFKSNFYSAGINQVLHQILIIIKIHGNILMLGCTDGFSAETSVIAAQTVIVGITPDAFTNVIEGGGSSSIVGDIFDYGQLESDSNGE